MDILSSISSGAVSGILTGVGTLAKDIRTAITGKEPISAEKAAELAQKAAELENALITAQTDINKIEAASSHWFVASWRPFVGWVGGFSLAYAAILEPWMSWIAKVCFGYTGAFPVVDTTITMQILFGILGLGALRSIDKKGKP